MKLLNSRISWLVIVALVAYFAGRFQAGPPAEPEVGHEHDSRGGASPAQAVTWTCPMHAQIQLPDPGSCPICGMDLVPLETGADDVGPRALAMSVEDRKLAEIQTAPVQRQFLTKEIRMVGKVDYDETSIRTVAAWIPGMNRLDRLYVDYTGIAVRQGDHLVRLYSPALLLAQEELLVARRRLETTEGERSDFMAKSNAAAYSSAREKLVLWGLTAEQVDEIESRGTAENHMTINSPVAGIVIHKAVNEGDYVDVGTKIYRIADLDHLWILLDVFEQDLAWIRYGQEVSIHTEAFPGQVFTGRISFLDPVLDERTRTVRVRVNVDNQERLLKPGMFVRATVRSRVAQGGRIMDPALAGKWISPMHPEVVKDGPGTCDVCGMDLVPAEELGIVSPESLAAKPLVIPASAVLLTGRRAVVYVSVPDAERPTFEGREVLLGQRAGDFYIVRSGLEENERVVVNGAFKIDSALQIQAKPSMMSIKGGAFHGRRSATFRASLDGLYRSYLGLQEALAADDVDRAQGQLLAVQEALGAVLGSELTGRARDAWAGLEQALGDAFEQVEIGGDLEALRKSFGQISPAVILVEQTFGHAGEEVYVEAFCPMAFDDQGASWLQRGEDIRNPYHGASMLACGSVERSHPGLGGGPDPRRPAEARTSVPEEAEEQPLEESASSEAAPNLTPLFSAYLAIHRALAGDDLAAAQKAASELVGKLTSELEPPLAEPLRANSGEISRATSIAKAREAFESLTTTLLEASDRHGASAPYNVAFCPMAFGRGAYWIQESETVQNPYYGSRMPRCGSIKRKLSTSGER